MLFSATYACARCRLRFPRRTQCPECGSAEIYSLVTRDGRARYRAAARTKLRGIKGMLIRLAPWASERSYLLVGGAVLAMAPAAVSLAMGVDSFQNLFLMSDGSTRYEGLSSGGVTVIGFAAAGFVVLVFTTLAKAGSALAERMKPATPPRTRVFSPSEDSRGDTTLTGIARRATLEIASPLSGEPCLLFGIRGEVGDTDLADADGGDFDLELPSGERVMISLEHAVFIADASAAKVRGAVGADLEELLESRAIPLAESTVLEEHLVRLLRDSRVTSPFRRARCRSR